jgi:hypothetical protein
VRYFRTTVQSTRENPPGRFLGVAPISLALYPASTPVLGQAAKLRTFLPSARAFG